MDTSATLTPKNATLAWSDALVLDLDFMDDTHREFVDLLANCELANDDRLLACFADLIEHTEGHFGREDHWMQETKFSSSNCHTTQHQVVLQVMHEGLKRGREQGDLKIVRLMAKELGIWFPQHAQSMDAALALHLRRVGYDEKTGQLLTPDELPAEEIHGCGGSTCTS